MLSYFTVTSNGLFLFKSFEERGVQKSLFQNYIKTNQLTGSGDYAKMFHRNYGGSLKIMSNEDHKITLWIFSVYLFEWSVAPSQHEAGIKKQYFYSIT